MRVEWTADLPGELREAIEPTLSEVAFPSWLDVLYVLFDPTDAENHATIKVDPEYRRARLSLGAHFIASPKHEREDTLRHEFAHVMLGPVHAAMTSIIESAVPPKLRAMAEAMWVQGWEATTTDLGLSWRRER